ncbi:aldo/keto reductase [Oculatella sp. LEGE 06141]|uniref:aldo/keto reductase n=1 Tax=Oculatella sp. LEGE 06141 TaxID=1828648 RepID=UPI001881820B|nr:aldo/keto reductase [Oculatella sp. LEGE 06141]MBE9180631.1 aldo/keto reductase [Oculatella sp. LEGE 06141]
MLIADLSTPDQAPSNPVDVPNPIAPESGFSFYRKLGRTDLTVSCLGLGGGGAISSEDTLYAFDQGINYFFYSSDLHHHLYRSMAGALHQLCRRGAARREQVVLATVTYIKNPEVALAALLDQFQELGIDYVDVLFWGWIGKDDASALAQCLNLSRDLRGPHAPYCRVMERMFGVSERLKKMGAVRYIGASFHDLDLAQQWLNSPLLDVVMVRHNISHRSAQKKIFSQLDSTDRDRPGIVTFKSTGSHTGLLWEVPVPLSPGCWRPTAPDLYRYSLTQPCVDICLTGLRCREEVDAAIKGVQQGGFTPTEIEYLNLYGDLSRNRLNPQEILPEKLIYRS